MFDNVNFVLRLTLFCHVENIYYGRADRDWWELHVSNLCGDIRTHNRVIPVWNDPGAVTRSSLPQFSLYILSNCLERDLMTILLMHRSTKKGALMYTTSELVMT